MVRDLSQAMAECSLTDLAVIGRYKKKETVHSVTSPWPIISITGTHCTKVQATSLNPAIGKRANNTRIYET